MRVLVVEDCRSLADLVAEGLSDQGIAADVAYDGTEAAGKLVLHCYDVVVLDRSLPGVPGDTLCQMVSSSNERSMVLMLSGAASPAERVDGLGLGADDYLAKPFHFPELVMRVRALARRQPRACPASCVLAALNSTAWLVPLGATGCRSDFRPRSSLCWKRSWPPPPAS